MAQHLAPHLARAPQVVMSAIGVDVSVEKRGSVYVPMMAVSLCGLLVGVVTVWVAVIITLQPKKASLKWVHALVGVVAALLGWQRSHCGFGTRIQGSSGAWVAWLQAC